MRTKMYHTKTVTSSSNILFPYVCVQRCTIQRQSLVQAIYCSPMYAYKDVPYKDNH